MEKGYEERKGRLKERYQARKMRYEERYKAEEEVPTSPPPAVAEEKVEEVVKEEIAPEVPVEEEVEEEIKPEAEAVEPVLADIEGIGSARANKLESAGIKTLEDLAGATPVEIAGIAGVSIPKASEWTKKAAELK